MQKQEISARELLLVSGPFSEVASKQIKIYIHKIGKVHPTACHEDPWG
jgi:hypothetical protein